MSSLAKRHHVPLMASPHVIPALGAHVVGLSAQSKLETKADHEIGTGGMSFASYKASFGKACEMLLELKVTNAISAFS